MEENSLLIPKWLLQTTYKVEESKIKELEEFLNPLSQNIKETKTTKTFYLTGEEACAYLRHESGKPTLLDVIAISETCSTDYTEKIHEIVREGFVVDYAKAVHPDTTLDMLEFS